MAITLRSKSETSIRCANRRGYKNAILMPSLFFFSFHHSSRQQLYQSHSWSHTLSILQSHKNKNRIKTPLPTLPYIYSHINKNAFLYLPCHRFGHPLRHRARPELHRPSNPTSLPRLSRQRRYRSSPNLHW